MITAPQAVAAVFLIAGYVTVKAGVVLAGEAVRRLRPDHTPDSVVHRPTTSHNVSRPAADPIVGCAA